MSINKSKKRRLEKEAARQSAEELSTTSTNDMRRIWIYVTLAFVILVGAIIGINHYFSPDQKFLRLNVIQVDDQYVSMDYFVRRCFATGSDPLTVLTGFTKELVLQKEAEAAGLVITDQQIHDQMLKNAQGTSNTTLTDKEFNEWFRQRLNDTKLTEKEYKNIVRTQIISTTLYNNIVKSTPTTAAQVNLSVIIVPDENEANEVVEKYNAGESFADLAKEYSMDPTTRDNGGDVGWVPRGVLYDSRFDDVIFDTLNVGELSDPQAYYDTTAQQSDPSAPVSVEYFLFLVTDKADSRQVDDQYLQDVYSQAFDNWVAAKIKQHEIHYYGINGGFDSETYSWVNYQIQKLTSEKNSSSSSSSSSSPSSSSSASG